MDELDAPKYVALKDCVFEYNLTSSTDSIVSSKEKLILYPNPTNCGSFFIKGNLQKALIEIYTLDVRLVFHKEVSDSDTDTPIMLEQKGIYIIIVKKNGEYNSFRLLSF